MKITVTLSESEIIAILKDHFNRQGFSVYDWQIYEDHRKEVNSDLRMRSESLANLLPKEDERYDF
ncbi:hypothetical protein TH62_20190 [Bacillus sp. TH008]|nr:hypothetical protein TH62_20190 [Bacillus sp. TH008]